MNSNICQSSKSFGPKLASPNEILDKLLHKNAEIDLAQADEQAAVLAIALNKINNNKGLAQVELLYHLESLDKLASELRSKAKTIQTTIDQMHQLQEATKKQNKVNNSLISTILKSAKSTGIKNNSFLSNNQTWNSVNAQVHKQLEISANIADSSDSCSLEPNVSIKERNSSGFHDDICELNENKDTIVTDVTLSTSFNNREYDTILNLLTKQLSSTNCSPSNDENQRLVEKIVNFCCDEVNNRLSRKLYPDELAELRTIFKIVELINANRLSSYITEYAIENAERFYSELSKSLSSADSLLDSIENLFIISGEFKKLTDEHLVLSSDPKLLTDHVRSVFIAGVKQYIRGCLNKEATKYLQFFSDQLTYDTWFKVFDILDNIDEMYGFNRFNGVKSVMTSFLRPLKHHYKTELDALINDACTSSTTVSTNDLLKMDTKSTVFKSCVKLISLIKQMSTDQNKLQIQEHSDLCESYKDKYTNIYAQQIASKTVVTVLSQANFKKLCNKLELLLHCRLENIEVSYVPLNDDFEEQLTYFCNALCTLQILQQIPLSENIFSLKQLVLCKLLLSIAECSKCKLKRDRAQQLLKECLDEITYETVYLISHNKLSIQN